MLSSLLRTLLSSTAFRTRPFVHRTPCLARTSLSAAFRRLRLSGRLSRPTLSAFSTTAVRLSSLACVFRIPRRETSLMVSLQADMTRVSAKAAYKEAGITAADIRVIELHDCCSSLSSLSPQPPLTRICSQSLRTSSSRTTRWV